jgi:hypothetical protein
MPKLHITHIRRDLLKFIFLTALVSVSGAH